MGHFGHRMSIRECSEGSLIGTLRRCLQKLCDSSTVPSPTFWTGTADPPRCQHLVAMVGFDE